MELEHQSSDTHTSQRLLAKNLVSLLKKNHVTASQLAHALELPLITIRRLLSGETEDPRISTLKSITDYFNVSIDFIVHDNPHAATMLEQRIKSYRVPKRSWSDLTHLDTLIFTNEQAWESIFISQDVSASAFALESKPSMYLRFPRGTIFVIDPEITPKDGDIVLVHFKENNDYTLKELMIDPPEMRLNPLVADFNPTAFQAEHHTILGVVVVTLLYS